MIVGVHTHLSRHHRKPISKGGSGGKNIRLLPMDKHQAWHVLFTNMTPFEIADEMNKYYLDLGYKMVVYHV